MSDHTDPSVVVDLMELTAAELERRGERMLKLSRDLLAQAAVHATLAGLPEERSVGRNGPVTEVEAIKVAKELQAFTRAQYAEALGLQAASVSRWLAKLIQREHPIVERCDDGTYAYINPAPVSGLRTERPQTSKRERARKVGQRMGAGGLEGTGQTLRGVAKELQPTVRAAINDGWTLSKDGSGHMRLTRESESVGFASTPRNAGDAASALRQKLRSQVRVHKQTSRNGHRAS